MNFIKLEKLRQFLDSQPVNYVYLAFANNTDVGHPSEFGDVLERNLLESVLITISRPDKHESAILIVPATRRPDLASLKKIMGGSVEFATKQQAQQRFPDDDSQCLLPFPAFHTDLRIFYAQEILQMEELNFAVQSRNHRIKMRACDFLRLVDPGQCVAVTTIAKYKIEVAQLFPPSKRDSLQTKSHCMLGFSLQSHSFTPARLTGMAEWISKHFSQCSVLIGDGIHRITLEINGVPPEYATNRALRIGREIMDYDAPIFNRYQKDCQFHLISTAELQTTADYHRYHQQLTALFGNNDKFRASVMLFAEGFVGERFQHAPAHRNYCLQKSCEYLLEEIAITALLIKQGVFVFVYPGTLRIMQELSQGAHPDAPAEFAQLVSVNLRQKRR